MRILFLSCVVLVISSSILAMRKHSHDLQRLHTLSDMNCAEFKHISADEDFKAAIQSANKEDALKALQQGANFRRCNPLVHYFKSVFNSNQENPLIDHEFVAWLIEEGAPINPLEGANFYSPLVYALQLCCNGCCPKALLKAGADARGIDVDLLNPIIGPSKLKIDYQALPFLKLPIVIAIERGNLDNIKLLVEHGASLKSMSGYGKNLLHYAVESKDVNAKVKIAIIRYLCQNGVDPQQLNKDGYSPLHLAIKQCDLLSIGTLLSEHANIEQLTSDNVSSLDMAIVQYNKAVKEKEKHINTIEVMHSIIKCLMKVRELPVAHPHA